MPRFRTVDVHPYGGHVDRPWCEDPDADAFARSARRVCEAYSRALALQDLRGKNSTLVLHLVDRSEDHDSTLDTTDPDHVHVVVLTDYWEGSETARVTLPAGVADLSADARALLVLDVVHGAAVRLARARSMDVDRLGVVRQTVLADGLRFVWTSPPKASPDRQHQASARFEMTDDGFGRARVLVHRRADAELVAVSAEHLAFSSSEGFARAAKTLRWRDSQTVQLTPYSDWIGTTRGTKTLVVPGRRKPSAPSEPGPVVEDVTTDVPRPAVLVEGRGSDAPEGNEFPEWIQGGARFFVDGFDLFGYGEWLETTIALMAADPDWNRWWEPAGQPGVDLVVHVQALDDDLVWPAALGDPQAVTARRFRDRVEVHYRTTAPSPQASPEQSAEWARQDLARAVAKLTKRFRLAPAPELPHLDEPALEAARALAELRARNAARYA